MEDTIEAYTDGSSLPHPRRGGIGIRFVAIDDATGEEFIEDLSPPGYPGGTNQEMEILAVTTALGEALELDIPPEVRRLVVRTDSSYVQNNYKRAIFQWPREKWLNREGAPIENAEDWRDFGRAYKKACERFEVVRIDWVKGHGKNPHNKAAHRLAQDSARNPWNKRRKVVQVRRKRTEAVVSRGSVRMEGQVLTIYVSQSGRLNVQKLYRVTYNVLSEDSPYAGMRDIIICDKGVELYGGHTYEVKFNENQRNPRVVEVLREIVPAEEPRDDESEPLPRLTQGGMGQRESGESDSTNSPDSPGIGG